MSECGTIHCKDDINRVLENCFDEKNLSLLTSIPSYFPRENTVAITVISSCFMIFFSLLVFL